MKKHYSLVLVLIVIVIVVGSCRGTSPTSTPEPTAESTPTPEPVDVTHPRLFFTADEVSLLREQAETTHNEIWQPILEYVDTIVAEPPPRDPPVGMSDNDWRHFGNDLIAIAFTCVITDENLYCDAALDYMLTMADWSLWSQDGKRDLGLAHSIIGNAIAYDWLYSHLTPEERVQVRTQLARKTQEMYNAGAGPRENGWGNWWRLSYMQNHYWTNNNAVGLASLVLEGEDLPLANCRAVAPPETNLYADPGAASDPASTITDETSLSIVASLVAEDSAIWWQIDDGNWVDDESVRMIGNCKTAFAGTDVWLDHAIAQLTVQRDILNGIGDGSWHESVHYQSYVLTIALPFMLHARELAGIDLFPDEYFQNYVNWRIYNNIAGTPQPLMSYANFEPDWGAGYAPQNILRFLAAEYQDGSAEWMAEQLIADERFPAQARAPWYVFEFLYYDSSIEPTPPTLPQSAHFPDAEGVIWRTGWEEDSLAFGLKTGPYGGQFAYNTFMQGTYPWSESCEETGCQLNVGHNHEDTNTFYLVRDDTWLIPENAHYNSAESSFHNTILIDGEGQYRPPADSGWRAKSVFEGASGVVEMLANTPDFDYIASSATTRYPGKDLEDLTRHVLFVRPNYFIMVDHIAAEQPHDFQWQAYLGGPVTIEDNWIRSDADNEQVLGIAVLAPDDYSVETGSDELPFVSIQPATPQDNVRLIHAIYPGDQAGWEQRPEFQLLNNSPVRTVIEVDRTETDGLIDHLIIQYKLVNGFEMGDYYEFDGNVAAISRDEDGNPVRILMVGGTHLCETDIEDSCLIEKNASELPLQVTIEAETASLSGDYVGAVTLHAPSVETVVMVDSTEIEFERDGEYINFEISSVE